MQSILSGDVPANTVTAFRRALQGGTPGSLAEGDDVVRLVTDLHEAYTASGSLTASERRQIDYDAAMKLCYLAQGIAGLSMTTALVVYMRALRLNARCANPRFLYGILSGSRRRSRGNVRT